MIQLLTSNKSTMTRPANTSDQTQLEISGEAFIYKHNNTVSEEYAFSDI